MLRTLVGFGVAAILTVVLLGCSGDEDAAPTDDWWEPLVAYLPADKSREFLYVADYSYTRDQLGQPAGDSTEECFALLETDVDLYFDLTNAIPVFDPVLLPSLSEDQPPPAEEVVGFNLCQLERMAFVGADPDGVMVLVPEADTSAIPALLENRGYTQRDHNSRTYYATEDDGDPSDALYYLNRLFIDDIAVVRSSADPPMEASLDAYADESQRDADAYTLLSALGEFQAAYFLPSNFDFKELDPFLIGQGGGFVPNEQVDAKIREIVQQYRSWGQLPAAERVAFAYSRANDAHEMKVALLYPDEADADAAADELERRLGEYVDHLRAEPICQGRVARPAVETTDGGSAVIATCVTEKGATWMDLVFRGVTLFLVEKLPEP